MKCKQCGAEIKNDEKFCRICGARLPVETAETKEKPERGNAPEPKPAEAAAKAEKSPEKKAKPRFALPKKAIIISAVAVVAVVAIVIAVMLFRGGGNSELSLDPNRPFVVEYYDRVVVYAADGAVLASVSGYDEVQESVWNSTIAIRQGEESPYSGTLKVVANGVVTTIDNGVCDIVVSADGSHIAYIKRTAGWGYGKLYVYEVESGESRFIDTDVILDTVVLSPDGSRLAYNIFDDASDCEHTLFGKSTGEGKRLLDCERMYALSNDGKYMYFENNGRLYVHDKTRDERVRICELDTLIYPMLLNSDGSKLVYAANPLQYWEGTALHSSYNTSAYIPLGYEDEIGDAAVEVVRVQSFEDILLRAEGRIIDDARRRIASCVDAVGSEGGKTFVYIDKDGYIRIAEKGYEKFSLRPDQTPTELFADAKLEHIYFTNERGELWRLNGEKTTMVSADASNFCMSESGTLYFLYDGVVLCRADGSERVSLGRMEDFLGIEAAPQGAVVKLRSGDAVYYRDGSTEGVALSTTVVTTPTEVE